MFASLEGKPALVWEVMDEGTRFWLCALPTEGRAGTERQAEQALAEALRNAKERPRDLLTGRKVGAGLEEGEAGQEDLLLPRMEQPHGAKDPDDQVEDEALEGAGKPREGLA